MNGYAGVDFNDVALTADALDHALHAMLAAGVTGCLPTLITAGADDLVARFAALDAAVERSRLGPLMVSGYHLEGPFLNAAAGFAGCHPAEAMALPETGLLARLVALVRRPIRLLTLAPELPGAKAVIGWALGQGMVVAIGHSDVRAEGVAQAVAAGARVSTHLGNGMAHGVHKFDNPLMAQLAEDRLTACVIADGIHVPPGVLRAMMRAKGPGRCVLVTDAVAAAGAGPGRYGFAGMVVVGGADGSARTPEGALAGSTLTLDQAVRNVVGWGIADQTDAVAMASTLPAGVVGEAPRGRVIWDGGLRVVRTEVGGMVHAPPATGARP